jgi:hypothetical protein
MVDERIESPSKESGSPIILRDEVLQRVLLAKSLLHHGRRACEDRADLFEFARGLLLLHDAAEATLGAVADHLHARLEGNRYLLDYFTLIEETDPDRRPVPYRHQMRNLNTVRNILKHQGIFPDRAANAHFPITVAALLEDLCRTYLGLDFEAVSLKGLVEDATVRGYVEEAERKMEGGSFEQALISLGYAMYHLVESSSLPWSRRVFGIQQTEERFLFTEPHSTNYSLKLLEHGIDPFTYHRFRNLTPRFAYDMEDKTVVYEWHKDFGHPANWTNRNVRFCLQFCIECALRVQRKPAFDYDILYYPDVYEDVITPTKDEVILWSVPSTGVQPLGSAEVPQREPVFVLKRGESIVGWASDSGGRPEDWFIISKSIPLTEGAGTGFGFVARSEVNVTRRERERTAPGAGDPSG